MALFFTKSNQFNSMTSIQIINLRKTLNNNKSKVFLKNKNKNEFLKKEIKR